MGSRTSASADRWAHLRLPVSFLLLAGSLAALPRGADATTGDAVLLNEALVSHTGADTTEYVELFGVPGTPLAGLSFVSVEGDSATTPGTIDRRVDLPADARLGGNGFYLVGNPAGLATTYHVTPDLAWGDDSLENGSQTLALVQTSSLGAGPMITGSETVFDAVALTDAGATDQWFWSAPVVGPDDGFLPGGARRLADGVDTDTAADWAFADDLLGSGNTPTPATPYNAPPAASCGPAVTTDEGTATSAPLTATDPDGRVTSFAASATPDPGTVTVESVVAATAAGATATATLQVSAATPPGSYTITVTASNDDATPQIAVCQLQVTVNDLPDPTPVTPPPASTARLWDMANRLLADGVVASKATLITDRLDRIDRFLQAGQDAAAAAQLVALGNQVMGLSPRWISPADAGAVAAEADRLRTQLAP